MRTNTRDTGAIRSMIVKPNRISRLRAVYLVSGLLSVFIRHAAFVGVIVMYPYRLLYIYVSDFPQLA
jgi:hypothetical protein